MSQATRNQEPGLYAKLGLTLKIELAEQPLKFVPNEHALHFKFVSEVFVLYLILAWCKIRRLTLWPLIGHPFISPSRNVLKMPY